MADVYLAGSDEVFPEEMEAWIRAKGHEPKRIESVGQVLSSAESGGACLMFLSAGGQVYDALDLLGKILSRNADACVIVTSAQPSFSIAVDAIRGGAWDCLPQPLEQEKVELLLGQIFAAAPGKGAADDSGMLQLITENAKFKSVIAIADRVASGAASVLILGESGTGKELLARYIHEKSPRAGKPYVAVNCAALPESLLESELFGHEKGAFTGAIARKSGKFELASGGTILLDEITEMDVHLQGKLLRVLQERTIDRLGGREPIPVDVRVIATSNRKVQEYIREGKFREDLFYRLNVIPLHLPPLRERPEDIPPLVDHFIVKHNERNNKSISEISPDVIATLLRLPWRGNVRELENVVERAVVLAEGNELRVEHLLLDPEVSGEAGVPPGEGLDQMVGMSVHEMEKNLILNTLKRVSDNRSRAAEMLGISIRTLRNKLKEYEASVVTPDLPAP